MWLHDGSVNGPETIIFIILWRQLERMRSFTQARATGQDGREWWTKNMNIYVYSQCCCPSLIQVTTKFVPISGFTRDSFHWLHIQQRIPFKTLSLMTALETVSLGWFRLTWEIVLHSGFFFTCKSSLRPSTGDLMIISLYDPIQEFCLCWPLSLELSSTVLEPIELLFLSPLQQRKRLKTFLIACTSHAAGWERCWL